MIKVKKLIKPPLNNVAFEINFAPKLKILEGLADFQDAISTEYPEFAEEQLLTPLPSSEGGKTEKLRRHFLFENNEKTRLLRISIINFNFIESQYKSFNDYSGQVNNLWSKFYKIVGDLKITRAGVRYVNYLTIPIERKGINIEKYVKPYFVSSRLQEKELKSIYVETRTVNNGLHMTIRSGIRDDLKIDGKHYVRYLLDYDCYQHDLAMPIDIKQILGIYHRAIEELFLSDIKEDYKAFMESGKWK